MDQELVAREKQAVAAFLAGYEGGQIKLEHRNIARQVLDCLIAAGVPDAFMRSAMQKLECKNYSELVTEARRLEEAGGLTVQPRPDQAETLRNVLRRRDELGFPSPVARFNNAVAIAQQRRSEQRIA